MTALREALDELEAQTPQLDLWARRLAEVLTSGGRLLIAGNGGSAAQAQHLAAELVGRYRLERPPFSAIALNT
ncbi:MAG TPA: SIS domain-containing protein, partial [Herpetosiphonaceae bacterium]|nr:SIS domain-containing protein [Herpetosiphonaceae bacterium]